MAEVHRRYTWHGLLRGDLDLPGLSSVPMIAAVMPWLYPNPWEQRAAKVLAEQDRASLRALWQILVGSNGPKR